MRAAIDAAAEGEPLDLELRLVTPDGGTRLYRALGELERDEDGDPVRLRGLKPGHHRPARGRAARWPPRSIADELQRSLLPELTFDAEQLEVAAYYRAGVAGTQVGGDWYDVIDVGAGRTALVLGDVVGRGVRAAAVMGQLRAAVRAYAQLELSPADVLECLDEVVRHLGPEQLVTCLYAVFDPRDRSLIYANAGHLPPLLALPGEARGPARRRRRPAARHRCGRRRRATARRWRPGALLAIYTDGLVERRDRVIDDGIDPLAEALGAASGDVAALVDALVPDGSDDDIALLTARVLDARRRIAPRATTSMPDPAALRYARAFVTETLAAWGLPDDLRPDALLIAGELVTNAVLHGKPPIELRLRLRPDVPADRGRGRRGGDAAQAAPDADRRSRPRPAADGRRRRALGHAAAARPQDGLVPAAAGALRRHAGARSQNRSAMTMCSSFGGRL